jgi:hypothetical protein
LTGHSDLNHTYAVCIPLAVACVFCIPSDKDLKQMHYDTLKYDAETGDKRSVALLAELESLPHPTAFDYVGTFLLLSAMVLTIFGLTDGSEGGGWCVLPAGLVRSSVHDLTCPPSSTSRLRAQPIVTLVLGVLLFPLFFWYETRIDPINALITPAIWKIKNVTSLMLVALTPYAWWYGESPGSALSVPSMLTKPRLPPARPSQPSSSTMPTFSPSGASIRS